MGLMSGIDGGEEEHSETKTECFNLGLIFIDQKSLERWGFVAATAVGVT